MTNITIQKKAQVYDLMVQRNLIDQTIRQLESEILESVQKEKEQAATVREDVPDKDQ